MYDPEYLASDKDMTPEPEPLEDVDVTGERYINWEANHKAITAAISEEMRAYRATPPTITQIASRTGLSRQTVYNHMREFATDPAFKGKTNMFDLMKHDVMMRLASSAIGGDMQAIRLYLQLTGMLDKRKEKK